jgi:O-methyltransferase
MTNITLQGLTSAQLIVLGDAALKAGDVALARGLYRNLVKVAPHAPQAQARYGLTIRPHRRTVTMLDALKALEAIPNANVFIGEGIATWLKDPAFIADDKFMALAAEDAEIAPSGVANWHWNLQTVLWAAKQVRDLPGDFVELGVYKGHTTRFLARYLDFQTWPKRWWLYDTFDGVPEDQIDEGRDYLKGQVYGASFSFSEVRDRFAPFANIQVIQGRVPEILAEAGPEGISLLHIDLNNTAAEIGALDALYDRLCPGGIIVFDDFGWSTSAAQAKAENAWFAERGLSIFQLPTGQGLFVKPPQQASR